MGASCGLTWRSNNERERIWVVNPGHPIASGIGEYFEIPKGGDVRRAVRHTGAWTPWCSSAGSKEGRSFVAVAATRGGEARYSTSDRGDQDYPIYYHEKVLQVIKNAVLWAAPEDGIDVRPDRTTAVGRRRPEPLEDIRPRS